MSNLPKKPLTGAERIAAERQRQVTGEHWTAYHDDRHRNGALARAAAYYAVTGLSRMGDMGKKLWPRGWRKSKNAKHDRIRRLEIAGALIAAEIDRLLRLESK